MLRDWFRRDIERPLVKVVGGPARLRVITLLACVLALDSADKATVGAVAAQLKTALHIGDVQVGLLVTASTAFGALVTLPVGLLADRINRTRLLVVTIVLWSLAMVFSGAVDSYVLMLLSRVLLGVIVAAAGPTVTSLTGDFFRPGERGRVFGYIIAGELVGVAFGFLISGNIAAVMSWRASFWGLAGIGLVLAGVIWRYLPEPARGGQSYLPDGASTVPNTEDIDHADAQDHEPGPAVAPDEPSEIASRVEARDIEPRSELVLERDPRDMSLWQAVRYIVSVPTYRTLVIASALGYFYFTGLRTFAIVFMRGHFNLGQAAASSISVGVGLGAVAGVLLVGRLGDALIGRGRLTGRVLMGAVAYLVALAALIPGMLTDSLLVAAPLFFLAAAGLGGANPAVDAARLDVMHSSLWGRAEGVRATLRFALEAGAPPLFGYVASWFGGAHKGLSQAARKAAHGAGAGNATGLEQTFLFMLVPLLAAGLILLFRSRRTYPRDVATTIASENATSPHRKQA